MVNGAKTTAEGLDPDHAQIHKPIPTRNCAVVGEVRQVAASGWPRERTVAAMRDRDGDQTDQSNGKHTQAEHPVAGDGGVWFLVRHMMTAVTEPDGGGVETVHEQHREDGEDGQPGGPEQSPSKVVRSNHEGITVSEGPG